MSDDLDFVEEFGVNPGDPLVQRPGHVSHGRFERVLRAGHFAVTTEIAPPDSVDPDEVLARAKLFDGYVDAINATDGSGANCHMSSLGVCAILTRAGYSPIIQFSCRDRNRIAMQGDLLGAAALGVCSVLCLTGDDVGAGDHPEAKPVFDLDSISLLQTTKILRDESRFLSGRPLDAAPRLFVGASINPFVPPLENRVDQLAKKIRAGAEFIQSQYCFDIDQLKRFMARACDMGLHEQAYILVGVGVLGSAKTAKWLRSNVPGVHIPDAIINRLEGARNQKAEGRRIAVELMQQIKETPGVAGAHLMAYRHEEWVGEIVKQSGVLGDRKPWAPEPLDSTIGVVTPLEEVVDSITGTDS
ncbi:methylenetetrahydrofolate reductase [Maritalea mediterranea]|uniref:Methylenetetrahydrofolate reductase n=1 Tax=Maritalea mediterranea TaxID=2909667 RepID=A0ABS9E6G4_9HYPH|nr:methylenetetrahydrofolate reductase [Maritalea mediterranea]MCF4098457.1 methylenetetrahydrofolate reductase [Maritalea mediterranea]